jgi:plasmid stability protein
LNLPTDLIRNIKVLAAERDTTINAFVRETLEDAVLRREQTADAVRKFLSLTEHGLAFRADLRSISRDEAHERP